MLLLCKATGELRMPRSQAIIARKASDKLGSCNFARHWAGLCGCNAHLLWVKPTVQAIPTEGRDAVQLAKLGAAVHRLTCLLRAAQMSSQRFCWGVLVCTGEACNSS